MPETHFSPYWLLLRRTKAQRTKADCTAPEIDGVLRTFLERDRRFWKHPAQRGNEEVITDEIQDEKRNTVSEPDRQVEAQELGTAIEFALASLPNNQREVILLSKIEGFSYGEIAQVLGMTSNAVKQMAHRGLIALRKKLAQWITP